MQLCDNCHCVKLQNVVSLYHNNRNNLGCHQDKTGKKIMNNTEKFYQRIDRLSIIEAEKLGYVVEKHENVSFVRKEKGGKIFMLIYSARVEMWQSTYSDAKRICEKSGAMLLGKLIPSCTVFEHWTCQPWMAEDHMGDWELPKAKDFRGERTLKNYSQFFGRKWENIYFMKNEKN